MSRPALAALCLTIVVMASAAADDRDLFFRLSGDREDANWVGQWAPTFLILGLYNKIVKVAGSDRTNTA